MEAHTHSDVLVCDDHPICQIGLETTLREAFPSGDFRFTRSSSGREALELAQSHSYQLIFLDLRLPDIHGLDVLKSLPQDKPLGKIIILTSDGSPATLMQVLRYKVHAVLLKSYSPEVLATAVRHVDESDEVFLDPSLQASLGQRGDGRSQLSPREFEVLELIAKGHTNKAIARILGCSQETIKSHCTRITEKTKRRGRESLISWFYDGSRT